MFNPVTRIVGTRNVRELRKLHPFVEAINKLEPDICRLSDRELRLKTDMFRERVSKSQKEFESEIRELRMQLREVTIPQEKQKIKERLKQLKNKIFDPFLVETFAVVREAAKRHVAMRPFDVQLMGAIVLHQGKISEMATGEGKTLVATMPLYLNGLTGGGAHLVTVNDYLARRDRNWMGPVYESLGLSVGVIQHDMDAPSRQDAYKADITYGTNNEFGFDYLRDNMVVRKEDMVQREPHYAIVDEVDSILIDEARTPLIISGPAEESTDKYCKIDRIVRKLKRDVDYQIDEKAHTATLTEGGVAKAEKLLGVDNLFEPDMMELVHHITQALRAHNLFKRDVDYMVKDGQVVIVDEFTGRLMPGRRWSDGQHQAIEAKEANDGQRVTIERENQTLATITFQNYFRLYEKLAGMTGTADTEAAEFDEIYKLEVLVIPTNKPLRRDQHRDVIYKTAEEKFEAVVKEIKEMHKIGRPVLVGTISIEKSERLSNMLKREAVPHHVLNAKYHEMEAEIVARAGEAGAVTIATNMAGRGTDIVLGEGVPTKGGLHIIATERHEARRIDNQLRGRAGRQGDPGSSRFYLALEDDLMRIFASERLSSIMDRVGWERGVPLEHPWLTKVIETAQKRVEAHNFDIRKQLLEFDNVMNRQREVIYDQRRMVLEGGNLKEHIEEMLEEVVAEKVKLYASAEAYPEEWNLKGLYESIKRTFGITLSTKEITPLLNPPPQRGEEKVSITRPLEGGGKGEGDVLNVSSDDVKADIVDKLRAAYEEKERRMAHDAMHHLEQIVMLQVIDSKWKEHLLGMDHLREGIHLRAYAQRDPLVEYQHEGFELFQEMISGIKETIVEYMFKVQVAPEKTFLPQEILRGGEEEFRPFVPFQREREPAMAGARTEPVGAETSPQPGLKPTPYKREGKKIGRNDPCPCGSGKKYKKCCGK